MSQKFKFLFLRVESIVGNGENNGYQHFLLFTQCLQKASFSGSFTVRIVRKKVKTQKIISSGYVKAVLLHMCYNIWEYISQCCYF